MILTHLDNFFLRKVILVSLCSSRLDAFSKLFSQSPLPFQWRIYRIKAVLKSPLHRYKCTHRDKKRVDDLICSIIKWGLISHFPSERRVRVGAVSCHYIAIIGHTTRRLSPSQDHTTEKFVCTLQLSGNKTSHVLRAVSLSTNGVSGATNPLCDIHIPVSTPNKAKRGLSEMISVLETTHTSLAYYIRLCMFGPGWSGLSLHLS